VVSRCKIVFSYQLHVSILLHIDIINIGIYIQLIGIFEHTTAYADFKVCKPFLIPNMTEIMPCSLNIKQQTINDLEFVPQFMAIALIALMKIQGHVTYML
jgi:hypothetical protein